MEGEKDVKEVRISEVRRRRTEQRLWIHVGAEEGLKNEEKVF